MKKIISVILSMMILSSLFVAPMSVSSDGDGNLGYQMFEIRDNGKRYEQKVDENGSGNGWSWDAATKTLTLNGITDGNFYPYHVGESTGLITIVLADGSVNRFSGAFFLNGCKYLIKGNGELVIESATGYLYDENGAYLTDENGYGVEGPIPSLMDWNSQVTIESGTITAENRGVHLQGRLIINGGTLTLGCGIYGGLGKSTSKAIITGGKLITSLPDFKNLDKYTSGKSAVSFYKQDFDSPMIIGLEASAVTGKNGENLTWKQEEDEEGFLYTNLYDENGNLATYAEFAPADCYTKTGEKVDSWAMESVSKAMESGIIPTEASYGFVSDTYNSADLTLNITRGQFTALVVGLYEKMSGQEMEKGNMPFDDVRYIYEDYVKKAYNAGLIYGVSDTQFATDDFLTREQASVILSRVYTKRGGEITASSASFADDSEISDWAKDAVYFMAEKSILQGTGNNMFSPQANTQIQQAVAIAVRMLENM